MNILAIIQSALTEVDLNEVISVQPQQCNSFTRLMEIYRQDMTVTQSLEDCMAVCMAVHVAVALEGDPLWMYLVGAPSSGKSTICELLGSDEIHTRAMSKFTGLVSGSRQGTHLVPMFQGKCVVVKDGTVLLDSNPQTISQVFGELRDIFDGSLEAHYRNGVSASFSGISFGMIIGMTEKIYGMNMSALGERFLHVRLETTRDTEVIRNKRAIESIFNTTGRSLSEGNEIGDQRSFPVQRSFTAGFLSHLHSKVRQEDILKPKYTQDDIDLIQSLGDMIACSRAQAPRSREFGQNELLYDAVPEASTRVVKQIARLALTLCYVYGTNRITAPIRRLLVKTGLDTSYSRQHALIRSVALSEGLNRSMIAQKSSIPLETVTRRMDDLTSLGILYEATDSRPDRGRVVPKIYCTNWVQAAFRKVEEHAFPDEEDTRPKPPAGTNRRPHKRR